MDSVQAQKNVWYAILYAYVIIFYIVACECCLVNETGIFLLPIVAPEGGHSKALFLLS